VKYILRFRAKDREAGFLSIKNGSKKIETRAGTSRYRKIKRGDTLEIVCGRERIVKKVKSAAHFKTLEALFKEYPWRKIMPHLKTREEAYSEYYGYSGYREKLKKFGVAAFELE